MNATTEDGRCNQEEINRRKIEKNAFRLKLFDHCKTSTEKSSTDMFKHYVVLAGHDEVIDNGTATTLRRKFKAHHYKQKVQEIEGLPKITFTEEPFERFRKKRIQF